MNLIYSNPNGVDIGILESFEFDLAYGEDENDFTLELPLSEHCCEPDYIIHMTDTQYGYESSTEYGGVIDKITVDTEKQIVVYSGRTWHGILAKKIIQPPDGQDYLVVSGNAHDIIRQLLVDLGLDLLFGVPSTASDIVVYRYQFPRYIDAYSGIRGMLQACGGKLKFTYENTISSNVTLSAVWLTDYSRDAEWDSSQVTFKAAQTFNRVNHLICLGSGDLRNRHKIHLFADQNGGVQPYATTDTPLEDSDYILDERNKRILWAFENVEVLDYSSASDKKNYLLLSEQPDDWATNYTDYYYLDADTSSFKAIERSEDTELTVTSAQPSDWAQNYANYFTRDGKSVEGTTSVSYTSLVEMPPDWADNWGQYYYRYWNGEDYEWKSVEYVTDVEYVEQMEAPADWETAYGNYYQRKIVEEIVRDDQGQPVLDENGFVRVRKYGDGYEAVTLDLQGSVPAWAQGRYFTRTSSTGAPLFDDGVTKYKQNKTTSAPTWRANTYYTMTKAGKVPSFASGVYYREVIDHYASLVKAGLRRLEEIKESSHTIQINLDLQGEYDIGDIVGARDEVTGIEVWQPIVKKIVSIDRRGKTISYKVGDTSK